jgi:alpha-tubulin suppressor-like RCC1 family protein
MTPKKSAWRRTRLKTSRIHTLVVALLTTAAVTGPLVWADGGYFTKGESVAVSTDQRAIIIKNGDEISMTFSTAYSGEGDDFSWIIPTPVAPMISDVSETGELGETAFDIFQEYTAPISRLSIGGGWGRASKPASVSPVTVYGKVQLEHYEVGILGAATASPLLAWLESNGYAVDSVSAKVLDAYTREGWDFVAVKLVPGSRRHYENEFLPPLNIRYRHDRLVFPLRISSVSTAGRAAITLYVIAESTVSSSNLPTRNLVFAQSIPGWLPAQEYVEDCIRQTSVGDGQGLAVLWKDEYQISNKLQRILDQLMKNPFPAGAKTFLTRLETRMDPAAMTEDIQLVLEPSAKSFQVEVITSAQLKEPMKVTGLSDVVAIAASEHHTVVLKEDGTVWAWGENRSGELGDGTTFDRLTPVRVSGLTDVVAITAGGSRGGGHTVALKADGTVWACGQLGGGRTPKQVPDLSKVVAIAAGAYHALSLKADGTVWAWGRNWNGQLGVADTRVRAVPTQVLELSGVVSIAAGGSHSVALKADGTVWTWGWNSGGQLGVADTSDRWMPVLVRGLSGVVAITAGERHTGALKADGTVWDWGENFAGELGDGTTFRRSTPVRVSALTDIVAVTTGGSPAGVAYLGGHTVALKRDGTVWTWGQNGLGQLGDGTTTIRHTPVQVLGLSEVTAISAADSHTMALKADGTVWAWGVW